MTRAARDVVFVDGVRTPFGKAGPTGLYAETRADDLVVRLHPGAAAAQPGPAARAGRRGRDRRDHPDRRPGPDPRPHRRAAGRAAASVPGYSIDRMCAGAMTAVTTTAGGIAFGAYDVAHRRRASSTWAGTRWARASTPTRGSCPSGSSTPRRC